jgi:hypothetical protein
MSLLSLQKEWFFRGNHAQAAITPFLKKWFADNSIEHLWHSTGSPGFVPVDFFLFWRVKGDLMVLSLNKDSLTETLVGVTTTIAADEFATAIRQ